MAQDKKGFILYADQKELFEQLPDAKAMVHTTDFCGGGVSWRFCWELIKAKDPSSNTRSMC